MISGKWLAKSIAKNGRIMLINFCLIYSSFEPYSPNNDICASYLHVRFIAHISESKLFTSHYVIPAVPSHVANFAPKTIPVDFNKSFMINAVILIN